MAIPSNFKDKLSMPVIGAPLFLVSGPDLVIAQCKAGIIGSFPALNARPQHVLDCLLYTSPSPRDRTRSRMPSSA